MPEVLGTLEWKLYYLRVHVTFGENSEVIVTTPVVQVLVAME